MPLTFGGVITSAGLASRAGSEEQERAQRMANNRLAMAERFRTVQREMEQRKVNKAKRASSPNPFKPLELQELNRSRTYGAPTKTTGAAQQTTSQAGRQVGLSSIRGAAPGSEAARTTAIPSGAGGINNAFVPAPPVDSTPKRFRQDAIIPGRENYPERLQKGADTRGVLETIIGVQPQDNSDLTNSAGQVLTNTGKTYSGGPILTAGSQGQQTIGATPGGGGAVTTGAATPASYSGVTSVAAGTAAERQQIQQIDQMIAHLQARYEQLLPLAESPDASAELGVIETQIQGLALQRSQAMLNDSINEFAATSNPDRLIQVANAMGYGIGFTATDDGQFVMTDAEGKPTSKPAEAHSLATHLRLSFNQSFHLERMKMQHEQQLKQMEITGDLAKSRITAQGQMGAGFYRGGYGKELEQQGDITWQEMPDGNMVGVDGYGNPVLFNTPGGGIQPYLQGLNTRRSGGETRGYSGMQGNSQQGRFTLDQRVR
jgi:hypothetical protein